MYVYGDSAKQGMHSKTSWPSNCIKVNFQGDISIPSHDVQWNDQV